MRRRIRLTGRKQLSRSAVTLKIVEVPGKRLLSLSFVDEDSFKGFPRDSRLVVRVYENKLVELIEFGTLGEPKSAADLRSPAFVAPSCQLLVAASGKENYGLLLGSTDTWTLHANDEKADKSRKGILLFLPKDIAPRAWKLDIRENDYPIVFVDKRIPDPRVWAHNDPVFVSSVLPAIMFQVFDDILVNPSPEDVDWMSDWLRWSDILMPGKKPPLSGSSDERKDWIEDLIDTFCQRHRLSDRLINQLTAAGVSV